MQKSERIFLQWAWDSGPAHSICMLLVPPPMAPACPAAVSGAFFILSFCHRSMLVERRRGACLPACLLARLHACHLVYHQQPLLPLLWTGSSADDRSYCQLRWAARGPFNYKLQLCIFPHQALACATCVSRLASNQVASLWSLVQRNKFVPHRDPNA